MSTTLEFCVVERETPFICGAWGHVTTDMIAEIERGLRESEFAFVDDLAPDVGSIKVEATWIPDEYDYVGGVREVINAGYWNVTLLSVEKVAPEEDLKALKEGE